jgi:hypothetical protein
MQIDPDPKEENSSINRWIADQCEHGALIYECEDCDVDLDVPNAEDVESHVKCILNRRRKPPIGDEPGSSDLEGLR